MSSTTLMSSMVIISAVLFFVVGTRGWRTVDLGTFTVNARNTGAATLVISIIASLVGGFMFMGLAALAFEGGMVAVVIGIGYLIVCLFSVCLLREFAIFLAETGEITLDGALGKPIGRLGHSVVLL